MNSFIAGYLDTLEEDSQAYLNSGSNSHSEKCLSEVDLTHVDKIKVSAVSDNVFELKIPRAATIKFKDGLSLEQLIALEKENVALLDLAAQLISDSLEGDDTLPELNEGTVHPSDSLVNPNEGKAHDSESTPNSIGSENLYNESSSNLNRSVNSHSENSLNKDEGRTHHQDEDEGKTLHQDENSPDSFKNKIHQSSELPTSSGIRKIHHNEGLPNYCQKYTHLSEPFSSPVTASHALTDASDNVDFPVPPSDECNERESASLSETFVEEATQNSSSPEAHLLLMERPSVRNSVRPKKKRAVVLPVKLWVRIPFNDLTKKFLIKQKKNLMQHNQKTAKRTQIPCNCSCNKYCKRKMSGCSYCRKPYFTMSKHKRSVYQNKCIFSQESSDDNNSHQKWSDSCTEQPTHTSPEVLGKAVNKVKYPKKPTQTHDNVLLKSHSGGCSDSLSPIMRHSQMSCTDESSEVFGQTNHQTLSDMVRHGGVGVSSQLEKRKKSISQNQSGPANYSNHNEKENSELIESPIETNFNETNLECIEKAYPWNHEDEGPCCKPIKCGTNTHISTDSEVKVPGSPDRDNHSESVMAPQVKIPKLSLTPNFKVGAVMLKQLKTNSWQILKEDKTSEDYDALYRIEELNKEFGGTATYEDRASLRINLREQVVSMRRQRRLSKARKTKSDSVSGINETDFAEDSEMCSSPWKIFSPVKGKEETPWLSFQSNRMDQQTYGSKKKRGRPRKILSNDQLRRPQGKRMTFRQYKQSFSDRICGLCSDTKRTSHRKHQKYACCHSTNTAKGPKENKSQMQDSTHVDLAGKDSSATLDPEKLETAKEGFEKLTHQSARYCCVDLTRESHTEVTKDNIEYLSPQTKMSNFENSNLEIMKDSLENSDLETITDSFENSSFQTIRNSFETSSLETIRDNYENSNLEIIRDSLENSTFETMRDSFENSCLETIRASFENSDLEVIRKNFENSNLEATKCSLDCSSPETDSETSERSHTVANKTGSTEMLQERTPEEQKLISRDTSVVLNDDAISNFNFSKVEDKLMDPLIYHLNEEESKSHQKDTDSSYLSSDNSCRSQPQFSPEEASLHANNADIGNDDDGHASEALNLPSVFDERDCLSIFDEFDIDIDGDLFGSEQREKDCSNLSSLLGDECSADENHAQPADPEFSVEDKRDVIDTITCESSSENQVERNNEGSVHNKSSPNLENLSLIDDELSQILTGDHLELNCKDHLEPLWQSPTDEKVIGSVKMDSSIPKHLMIPNGFCYHFLKDGICPFDQRCRFKHSQPSADEMFSHCKHVIKAMPKKGNFHWAMSVYRRLREVTREKLLPQALLMSLLSWAMDQGCIADVFFILNEITQQNLFDKVICNHVIRLCWPQHMMYRADLEKIFFAFISLSIIPDSDCKLYMLHLFYTTRNQTLLWELLCSLNESEGFVVPAFIMIHALQYMIDLPHRELVAKFEQWVYTARPGALSHVDEGVMDRLRAILCRLVPACTATLLQLTKCSVQPSERKAQTEGEKCQHTPKEMMDHIQQEEFKSYFHRISGCAQSLNWAYLGETFVELCSKMAPTNYHYITAYVKALVDTHTYSNTVTNAQAFLSAVKHEKNFNVLLTIDTGSLSQIFCRLMISLLNDGHTDAAAQMVELVMGEKLLQFMDCSDEHSKHPKYQDKGVVLTAVHVCILTRKYELGQRVVEEYQCLFRHMSPPWEQGLISQCVHDLVSDITGNINHRYTELLLLKLLIKCCISSNKNICLTGTSNLFEVTIESLLRFGDWISAAEMFQILQRMSDFRNISPILVRKFLCGCVDADIHVPPDLYIYCIRYLGTPAQTFVKRPVRQILLHLGMTMAEIKLAVDHYLSALYSHLCGIVTQGLQLCPDDICLLVKLFPGAPESLDVPFLGSAPRTLDLMQCVVINIFEGLKPPIHTRVNHVNKVIEVLPLDLGRFLQQKDISDGRPKLCRQMQGVMKAVSQ